MSNNILELEVVYRKWEDFQKGIFAINEDYITFKPYNEEKEEIKEAAYRIVQTGFRKILQFIPVRFYIKTMSGRVMYFNSLKSRQIVKIIEKIIYK